MTFENIKENAIYQDILSGNLVVCVKKETNRVQVAKLDGSVITEDRQSIICRYWHNGGFIENELLLCQLTKPHPSLIK